MFPKTVATVLAVCLFSTVTAGAAWIDPELESRIAEAKAEDRIAVYVVLREQVDLGKALLDARRLGGGNDLRHLVVVTRLQELAEQTQAPVLSELSAATAAGEVTRVRPFWIANSVAVTATPPAIRRMARQPDVASIYLDYPIELIRPVTESGPEQIAEGKGIETGVAASNAPGLWAMGIDGTGTLACDQDTGAEGNHPAFADRWRGLDPGVAPSAAWFDPIGGETFPSDSGTHGTHTLGTMVGDDGGSNQIGMAPGAKWIGARTIDVPDGDIFSNAVAAFQWMADPDGNPATTDDVPDVVNNSWGLSQSYYGSCRADFNVAIDAVEAAGVAVVFAAGNEGSSAQSLRSPANRIESELNSFSVGALEADGETVASFSSRGPSDCDGQTLKPEIAAVGVDVRSSIPGAAYAGKSGTSMAAPHVSGAILLLRQAFDWATPEDLKYCLYMSAIDRGASGEDNDYGRGSLDVLEAYLYCLDYLLTSDGKVRVLADWSSCSDTLPLQVGDTDLTGPTVSITVTSDSDPAGETVVLNSTEEPGRYFGTLATGPSAQTGDGVLQLSDGDTITAFYVDADDGEGNQDVLKTHTANADCAPPDFNGLASALAGDHQVTLTWDPATDATDVVYHVYRATSPGGQDFESPLATVDASPYVDDVLNGLNYYYVVRAEDAVGNQDANTVERAARPTGPNLFWEETWQPAAAWEHPWTIVDGYDDGHTWTDQDTRYRFPGDENGAYMIVDSANAGDLYMDEELISEVISVVDWEDVQIRFYTEALVYNDVIADLDVALDGGPWENVYRRTGDRYAEDVIVDLTTRDFSALQLRFHYYNAWFAWWWVVDTVQLWGYETGGVVVCYRDDDGDGYGDGAFEQPYSNRCPLGWVRNSFDCDDADADIYPDAEDVCDGKDNDCDNQTDEDYTDYWCGLGQCMALSSCIDGVEECVPGEPGVERCDDMIDNDCDGDTDRSDPECDGVCAEAWFDYSVSSRTVEFTEDSYPGRSPIQTYFWEFGDGATSWEQNPSHTYADRGEYITCLTVDTGECVDRECRRFTVGSLSCGFPSAGATWGALLPIAVLLLGSARRRQRHVVDPNQAR